MTHESFVIGVDIGGTKTAAGLVRPDGTLVARATVPTPGASGPEAIISAVGSVVRDLVAASSAAVVGVGVGSAGVIDPATGFVASSTEVLVDWAGTDLRGDLSRAVGLRVSVDNDVNAHAVGEMWLGAARGAGQLLFVAVGTGVGAAIVVHGEVFHGAHHVAGEIGHLPSPLAVGFRCTCGTLGHLEAVAAGPAMTAQYAGLSGRAIGSLKEVAAAAADGDPMAVDVIRSGGRALGQAIGGLLNVLDPDQVVIGGGVSFLGDLWWDAVRETARVEAIPLLRSVPIAPAALGADAALFGAAHFAWKAQQ